MAAPHSSGPPYASKYAGLGGLPTNDVDTPIEAVFILLFIGSAVGHMTLFQLNKRRGHKFIFSAMMFGFSMARIVTLSLRIVWTQYPHNVRLAIAAQVFTAAGVLLLYIINLVLAQRLLRATHPKLGWSRQLSILFKVLYALVPLLLAMVITVVIQARYTLNPHTILIDGKVQLGATCYLLLVCVLPLPILALVFTLPGRLRPYDHFGHGPFAIKVATLTAGTLILAFGDAFRVGVGFQNLLHPRPLADPGWYNGKWVFWIMQFTVELIVVYLYLIVRVDLRFHVPNGSRGSYAGGKWAKEADAGDAEAREGERGVDAVEAADDGTEKESRL